MRLRELAIIVVLLAVMCGTWIPVAAPVPTGLCSLSPPVRLRKLHLVRPDLIPYPIDVAVYC